VDNEFYFAGESPYNNIYEDVEKFAYFSKAVLASLPYIDFAPDIIHCNDWQTGLIPVFLHTVFGDDNFYAGIKTVFTIHNLQFQGRWRIQEIMDITGLPAHIFNAYELESYGEANYLKGGVVYADYITTVSPTYANEITTVEGGEGLSGLMTARKDRLYGILNGIDYEEYNPQTDPYIPVNYSKKDAVSGKKENKVALQKELGLPVREDAFLIGIVSRMTSQKGFDLIGCVLDELLTEMDIQLVVLGSGESQYENMFHHYQSKYPDKVSVHIGFTEERSHHIYAASDVLLMPSMFEPCGLAQMIAMRYGTLPIVRETGGLRDTVEPYNEYENTGCGFSFANFNAQEMADIVRYAYRVEHEQKAAWKELIYRAMDRNFSWNASAYAYEKLYDKLVEM
jgi:starch synthase